MHASAAEIEQLVEAVEAGTLSRERWVHARWSRPRPTPHAIERYAVAVAALGVEVEGTPRVTAGEEAEGWAREWMSR